MYLLRDRIIILAFLLRWSAISSASHVTGIYNDKHQQIGGGLERILNSVLCSDYIGYGPSSGSILNCNDQNLELRKKTNFASIPKIGYSYTSGNQQQIINYNNEHQYTPSNAGNGYLYESHLSTPAVNNDNENTALSLGYQTSDNNMISYPLKGNYHMALTPGQSSNSYHYNVPSQEYYENTQPLSKEVGYSNDKPDKQQSSTLKSIFKGESYLPSMQSNYYQYEQKQGVQGQTHATTIDGYQHQSPKHSGYNYSKPQQQYFTRTDSVFKGKWYIPTPATPMSSRSYVEVSSSQGYSYEKPSTPFKGQTYLPLTSS